MPVDGISGSSSTSALYGQYNTSTTLSTGQASALAPTPIGASKFADAIGQALTQVEGTSAVTSGADTSGASQDPKQAEASFAQSLFSALQSQAGGSKAEAQASGHHHHHGGGGGGKIAGGLQSLAQQLSSTSTDGTDSTASTPLTDLQTSFNNLLAANGQSGTSASLPQFLQTLSQNLAGAPSAGNVVSTKV